MMSKGEERSNPIPLRPRGGCKVEIANKHWTCPGVEGELIIYSANNILRGPFSGERQPGVPWIRPVGERRLPLVLHKLTALRVDLCVPLKVVDLFRRGIMNTEAPHRLRLRLPQKD